MRRRIVLLLLFGLAVSTASADVDLISQAESLFADGEYDTGLELLTAGKDEEGLSAEERCNVLVALGEAYEGYTGDYSAALECYRLVVGAEVLASHASKSSARAGMMRIESLTRKYAEQNAVLDAIAKDPDNAAGEHIEYLEEIAAKSGDYYRLAEVYYYAGVGYASLGENERAVESLGKALESKAGLGVRLPVEEHIDSVREQLKAEAAAKAAKTAGTVEEPAEAEEFDRGRYIIAGALMVIAVIVLFIAKPWRRGRAKS